MRNGNNSLSSIPISLLIVLILPMRNGNISYDEKTQRPEYSSYPTYEEWKHFFKKYAATL